MTKLSEIIQTVGLEYAMETVENRAIPSMIDGLKPSQRFFLCSALHTAKDKMTKVASIAGRTSEFGYEHGETATGDAGVLMTSTWNNNVPLFDGDGSFGSRFVRSSAAHRYIYLKISENFHKLFKDHDLAPEHPDHEHIPPKFYLPVIPFVLLNGVKGIATGFATNILPYDPKSVVKKVEEFIKTGDIKEEPTVKFYDFKGKIEPYEKESQGKTIKGVTLTGCYSLKGYTLTITEIPFSFDREAYITLLDKLEEQGKIVSYTDDISSSNFLVTVKLKRDFLNVEPDKVDDLIINTFKLQENIAMNITVIDENQKLKIYDTANDLIKDFVAVRKTYVQQRIVTEKERIGRAYKLAKEKFLFISQVVNKELVLERKTKKDCEQLLADNGYEFISELLAMRMYSLTIDECTKLANQAKDLKAEYDYWCNTTADVEYNNDIQTLKKVL